MRSSNARKSIPVLLVLICFLIMTLSAPASALRDMQCGWPDEEGDTRPCLLGGGGGVHDRGDESLQEVPTGSVARPTIMQLVILLRDVVCWYWIP